jgi:hypothetical protein
MRSNYYPITGSPTGRLLSLINKIADNSARLLPIVSDSETSQELYNIFILEMNKRHPAIEVLSNPVRYSSGSTNYRAVVSDLNTNRTNSQNPAIIILFAGQECAEILQEASLYENLTKTSWYFPDGYFWQDRILNNKDAFAMARKVNLMSSLYLGQNWTSASTRKHLVQLSQFDNHLAHFAFDAFLAAVDLGRKERIIGTTGIFEFNEFGLRETGDFATLMLMPPTGGSLKIDVMQKSPWLVDKIIKVQSTNGGLELQVVDDQSIEHVGAHFLTKQHFKQFFRRGKIKGYGTQFSL